MNIIKSLFIHRKKNRNIKFNSRIILIGDFINVDRADYQVCVQGNLKLIK